MPTTALSRSQTGCQRSRTVVENARIAGSTMVYTAASRYAATRASAFLSASFFSFSACCMYSRTRVRLSCDWRNAESFPTFFHSRRMALSSDSASTSLYHQPPSGASSLAGSSTTPYSRNETTCFDNAPATESGRVGFRLQVLQVVRPKVLVLLLVLVFQNIRDDVHQQIQVVVFERERRRRGGGHDVVLALPALGSLAVLPA